MPCAPSCLCGTCTLCRGRASAARSRARRAAAREAIPEPIHQAIHSARPVALDALLSDWRTNNPGSIVCVNQSGVHVYPFDDDAMHFANTDEAIEFLTRPSRRTG
jgi:hypothetical protein